MNKIKKEEMEKITIHYVSDKYSGDNCMAKGFKNYGKGHAEYEKLRYYKDHSGIVHIEGLIKGTSPKDYYVLFKLRKGYRPKNAHQFKTRCCEKKDVSIYILNTGEVKVRHAREYWSIPLSGIHFLAEE